jgi:hypothetical protein
MSLIFATQLTAVATATLALFAIVTAFYAVRAFRKQSQEVSDQAKMLEVQSEQLAEQKKLGERQAEVLGLQADELHESLEERKREASARRRMQASQIIITHYSYDVDSGPYVNIGATVANNSNEPVYQAQLYWHLESESYGDPNPLFVGTIPAGSGFARDRKFPLSANKLVSGAVLTFRDAAGLSWIRTPDGALIEQSSDTVADVIRTIFEPSAEDQQSH